MAPAGWEGSPGRLAFFADGEEDEGKGARRNRALHDKGEKCGTGGGKEGETREGRGLGGGNEGWEGARRGKRGMGGDKEGDGGDGDKKKRANVWWCGDLFVSLRRVFAAKYGCDGNKKEGDQGWLRRDTEATRDGGDETQRGRDEIASYEKGDAEVGVDGADAAIIVNERIMKKK